MPERCACARTKVSGRRAGQVKQACQPCQIRPARSSRARRAEHSSTHMDSACEPKVRMPHASLQG